MKISVLIPAAGSGRRVGGAARSKALLPLAGQPVICYSLDLFSSCPEVNEIIVIGRAEDLTALVLVCSSYPHVRVVEGGAERKDSVEAGLRIVSRESTHIAVHDAARPLLHPTDWQALMRAAQNESAVLLAAPVVDTVKRLNVDGYVMETPQRVTLAAAQTPQLFRAGLLRQAYETQQMATDDATLVERLGIPVRVVWSERENFKITYADDLPRAAEVLCRRARGQEDK